MFRRIAPVLLCTLALVMPAGVAHAATAKPVITTTRDLTQYNAEVYVFCLQTARTHEAYDPLDVRQWEFYVVGRASIAARPYLSMGLATLGRLAGAPVGYGGLAGRIHQVAAGERGA